MEGIAPSIETNVGDHTIFYLLWDEPLDIVELEERIGGESHLPVDEVMGALSRCIKNGYAEQRHGLFRLTPKGRAARFAPMIAHRAGVR